MRILIVSAEYPPMKGGVGRYTHNLAHALKKKRNIDVHIATSSSPQLIVNDGNCESTEEEDNNNAIHYDIIKKGDEKNSDRLLNLIQELKPDIVNIQYERGLYEIDTTVPHIIKRVLHGSTLNKFYRKCLAPTVSTLHTVMPYKEYQQYIKERALRKEGRFGYLPLPLRAAIRRWVLERRYSLLFDVIQLSDEVICPAKTIHETVKRGRVIYHGAEPASLLNAKNRLDFRREFRLPCNNKLLLAFGYAGSYKGFEILDSLSIPDCWSLVVKQSRHERGVEKPIHIKNAINMPLHYFDDVTLSKLFFSCDAMIFPYKIVSVSGVLFDALAHGLPFIATDLAFFREFAEMDLGIVCNRNAESFSESLKNLGDNYDRYRNSVQQFNPMLCWNNIADNYVNFYTNLLKIS